MTKVLALAGIASLAISATRPIGSEPEIKAAALYNIVTFTDWPPAAFGSPEAPLIIGIFGQGQVANLLTDMLDGERWRGRRIVVRAIAAPAEARSCHVVYVDRAEHARWRTAGAQVSRLPILTVGDAEKFAEQGGIVQLAIERNRLRLIVNLSGARAGGLTISSKVLRLAQVIDDRTP